MQIITRRKTARSHAAIPPCCLLHDAVYQDQMLKKVPTRATLQRLLKKLADKANRIREQHHLPEHLLMIIIMGWIASNGQEALTPIKRHLHECKDHPSQYNHFRRKRRSHISDPLD